MKVNSIGLHFRKHIYFNGMTNGVFFVLFFIGLGKKHSTMMQVMYIITGFLIPGLHYILKKYSNMCQGLH